MKSRRNGLKKHLTGLSILMALVGAVLFSMFLVALHLLFLLVRLFPPIRALWLGYSAGEEDPSVSMF